MSSYKVISLFTGIGGFDHGFGSVVEVPKEAIIEEDFIYSESDHAFIKLKKQNFEIVFQNDILPVSQVLEWNNLKCANFNKKSIYDLISTTDFEFPECDVVIGGFPCQPFSNAGKRLGFNSDKSHDLKSPANSENNVGNLYKCFVEVVKCKLPKIFVAENVKGLLSIEGAINQICNDFSMLGYKVQYQLINCTDYGIAQTRQRVIIIGIRNDHTGNLSTNWNVITKNRCSCKLKHYLNYLEEPDISTDISQKLFSKAKKLVKGQGQSVVDLGGYGPTMRAEHHGNIEFRNDKRRLSVREAGLIQTFSPTFKFTEKSMSLPYKFIGNAVPPLLSYLIADKVNFLLTNYF